MPEGRKKRDATLIIGYIIYFHSPSGIYLLDWVDCLFWALRWWNPIAVSLMPCLWYPTYCWTLFRGHRGRGGLQHGGMHQWVLHPMLSSCNVYSFLVDEFQFLLAIASGVPGMTVLWRVVVALRHGLATATTQRPQMVALVSVIPQRPRAATWRIAHLLASQTNKCAPRSTWIANQFFDVRKSRFNLTPIVSYTVSTHDTITSRYIRSIHLLSDCGKRRFELCTNVRSDVHGPRFHYRHRLYCFG